MRKFQPTCHTLSNGIRVVHLQVPNQVAHLGFFFSAGSRYEQAHEVGLAHFLEHCLFKGTHTRNALHILSRIDAVGGELNAYTAKEELCLHASFSKEHTKRALELLADISIHSTFPEKEIEKEKEVILDEINSYLDSPSDKIFDDFEEQLFKNHPLGNNILGTRESVASFTQADLKRYVGAYFTADNMVISYVGNMSFKKLEPIMEATLKEMPHTAKRQEFVPFTHYVPFQNHVKEANYQAHAVLGGIAPSYKHDDRMAMSLLINILGGPALNSKLNLSVREKYGLAYTVEASYSSFVDSGFWQIYFGCEDKNIQRTMDLINKELAKFRSKEMSSIQLQRAKQQFKGQMALGMDVNAGLMQGLGKSMLAFNQIDTIQEIHQGIDKISGADLLRLSNEFLGEQGISSLIFGVEQED
ncbi:MAG: M16 family metallopeptidase [Crocinitomicaceae bacterium]